MVVSRNDGYSRGEMSAIHVAKYRLFTWRNVGYSRGEMSAIHVAKCRLFTWRNVGYSCDEMSAIHVNFCGLTFHFVDLPVLHLSPVHPLSQLQVYSKSPSTQVPCGPQPNEICPSGAKMTVLGLQ